MIRFRYANLQDVDRLPKKGDIVITENGNRVNVSQGIRTAVDEYNKNNLPI